MSYMVTHQIQRKRKGNQDPPQALHHIKGKGFFSQIHMCTSKLSQICTHYIYILYMKNTT